MATGAYVGVGGVARRIKSVYVGVAGVARKVTSAYVGVSNVARKWWNEHFRLESMSIAHMGGAIGRLENAILIAAGTNTNGVAYSQSLANVDSYSDTLTKTMLEPLSDPRAELAGAFLSSNNGVEEVLFAGGHSKTNVYVQTVDVYDRMLQRRTSAAPLSVGRSNLLGGSVGNYAIFCGGEINNQQTGATTATDAYNTGDTRVTIDPITYYADQKSAIANTGNYILFAGGALRSAGTASIANTCAYDTALTRKNPQVLSVARQAACSASFSGLALIISGYNRSATPPSLLTIETYDAALTRGLITGLPHGHRNGKAAKSGNNLLIAAGLDASLPPLAAVDVYDTALTLVTPSPAEDFTVPRYNFLSADIGTYAFFCSGLMPGPTSAYVATASVEVYDSTTTHIVSE